MTGAQHAKAARIRKKARARWKPLEKEWMAWYERKGAADEEPGRARKRAAPIAAAPSEEPEPAAPPPAPIVMTPEEEGPGAFASPPRLAAIAEEGEVQPEVGPLPLEARPAAAAAPLAPAVQEEANAYGDALAEYFLMGFHVARAAWGSRPGPLGLATSVPIENLATRIVRRAGANLAIKYNLAAVGSAPSFMDEIVAVAAVGASTAAMVLAPKPDAEADQTPAPRRDLVGRAHVVAAPVPMPPPPVETNPDAKWDMSALRPAASLYGINGG